MTLTILLTLVSIFLLKSIIICTASRQNQEPAMKNDAGIGVPDPAPNTVELLQDMQVKMAAFEEQLGRQAAIIATQQLQLKSQQHQIEQLKHSDRQAEIIAKKEIEGLKQLIKTHQEKQADTSMRQEQELLSQTKDTEELKQQVTTQRETIEEHVKQMTIQKRLLKKLSRKFKLGLDKVSNEITELATSISCKSNSPSRITRQETESNVAFSAFLNGNLEHLAPGHIIKMKGINLNEGHAYNPSNGIFTTPHNGVYLFSFAMEDYHIHQLRVVLVVDGTLLSTVATEPFHVYQNLQGTNVVILRLTTGQQVWTEIDMADSDDFIEGNSRYRATTFSGVFLYP